MALGGSRFLKPLEYARNQPPPGRRISIRFLSVEIDRKPVGYRGNRGEALCDRGQISRVGRKRKIRRGRDEVRRRRRETRATETHMREENARAQ